jgi:ADP-dependent NAD(P)H-hydrate dehydratase / NAD(P)H-hydrate epimerase
MTPRYAVLTPEQMNEADRLTIASGIAGSQLMENAGYAIMEVALAQYPSLSRAVVLCGPGNNGGDGYVVARLLTERGVQIALYRSHPPKPNTDAAVACSRWRGPIHDLGALKIEAADLVIDALYGAGFRGALQDADARAAELVRAAGVPVVAVDLPSGVDGLTGQHSGPAFTADHTVTFFCKKPGHLLYPGRTVCGRLHVADIGMSPRVLNDIKPMLFENSPASFDRHLPQTNVQTHKYARGAVGVFTGGPGATGAARLSALAAAKAGAGAVIALAPQSAVAELGAHLTSAMIRTIDNPNALPHIMADKKYAAFVIGPGFGNLPRLKDITLTLLQAPRPFGLVLDADVFTAFANEPEMLFAAIAKSKVDVVMTPHDGEFHRLFSTIANTDLAKHEKARVAAKRAHCTLVYKGPDTVIAAPDGCAAINTNGGPMLATAGSGDVLSGVVAGLLAQGMSAYQAACAAVHIHADAGQRLGMGLIAEALAAAIYLPSHE